MQEVAKALIYVTPFTILAMILGLKADTNWGAVLIGVIVGCVASVFFVALRQAFKTVAPEAKAVFSDKPAVRAKPKKPVTVRWWDVDGRDLGVQEQIEAPRSVAVANEKGVVR